MAYTAQRLPKFMRRKKFTTAIEADSAESNGTVSAFHQDHIRPFVEGLHARLWSKKRQDELNEFNRDVHISDEEMWSDIGTVAAVGSTILAVGGVYVAPVFGLLSVPGVLIGSAPVYKSAYDGWKEDGKINTDFLASLVQTVLLANTNLVLANLTPLAYFANKNLNLMARKRFEDSLAGMLDGPEGRTVTVLVIDADNVVSEQLKQIEQLEAGEIVVVYAGETIPVDGTITQGTAAIDERMLTGESQPVERGIDDTVYASTLVLSGKILVQVNASGTDTIIAQIEGILDSTFYYTSQRELWAQKLTDSLAIPTLAIGALTLPFTGILGAMAVVDANPLYRLSLAGNSSVLNFLNITSSKNILVKDGRVLEMLDTVDTFVFDKTGTLTEDTLLVGAIHTFGSYDEREILLYAAAAEKKQSHPLAQAIVQAANSRNISVPAIEKIEYRLGLGLLMQWDDKTVHVGSQRFISAENIPIPTEIDSLIASRQRQGIAVVLVAIDNILVGAIELHAKVREEAAALIAALQDREQTKSIIIVSGDNEAPTKQLAELLGISTFYSNTLPEGKANLIEAMQAEGRTVCFIGDGLNDSIALKQADVSITLQGASSLATSTAQVVLLDDNLEAITELIDIAKQFDNNQKTAMGLVLGSSGACLVGVLVWQFTLAQTIVLTMGGFTAAVGVSFAPWLLAQRNNSAETIQDNPPIIVES